ncbi:hypothetical protein IWX50DRAFT_616194 [Phyllosticta citricarpa]|uniref:Uncharacterized protein n=1 Tax=Phyllosticta citricarpa TaxID=55181 RepID=A0ABR1MLF5_9PEZI
MPLCLKPSILLASSLFSRLRLIPHQIQKRPIPVEKYQSLFVPAPGGLMELSSLLTQKHCGHAPKHYAKLMSNRRVVHETVRLIFSPAAGSTGTLDELDDIHDDLRLRYFNSERFEENLSGWSQDDVVVFQQCLWTSDDEPLRKEFDGSSCVFAMTRRRARPCLAGLGSNSTCGLARIKRRLSRQGSTSELQPMPSSAETKQRPKHRQAQRRNWDPQSPISALDETNLPLSLAFPLPFGALSDQEGQNRVNPRPSDNSLALLMTSRRRPWRRRGPGLGIALCAVVGGGGAHECGDGRMRLAGVRRRKRVESFSWWW